MPIGTVPVSKKKKNKKNKAEKAYERFTQNNNLIYGRRISLTNISFNRGFVSYGNVHFIM